MQVTFRKTDLDGDFSSDCLVDGASLACAVNQENIFEILDRLSQILRLSCTIPYIRESVS